MTERVVALIPARAGSKRVPDKNVTIVGGHPLLAYTVAAALDSGVFARVVVSTDSERYAAIARHYGADVPFLRPAPLAGDTSPDIEWVAHALRALADAGDEQYDAFSILRPTSPFRTADTIRRAWAIFESAGADSLRAVEPVRQHPGKMWVVSGDRLLPVLPVQPEGVPWHSRPLQALPPVWVQNASLEIAWRRCADAGSIAGEAIVPFFTSEIEGLDVNTPDDLMAAMALVAANAATLPPVATAPWREVEGGADG